MPALTTLTLTPFSWALGRSFLPNSETGEGAVTDSNDQQWNGWR